MFVHKGSKHVNQVFKNHLKHLPMTVNLLTETLIAELKEEHFSCCYRLQDVNK